MMDGWSDEALKGLDDLRRKEAEERRILELQSFIEQPNFPKAMRMKTFREFEVTETNRKAFKMVTAWHPDDHFGFLLMGPAGTGKTHLMLGLINNILENLLNPENLSIRLKSFLHFTNTAEFLEKVRTNFDESGELEKCKTVTYLFLDDLGVENLTDWSRDQLYRLFEYRQNQNLPTFITTNLSLDEIKARMHERILSRLKEVCVFVTLEGKDHRTDAMRENLKIISDRVKQLEEKKQGA